MKRALGFIGQRFRESAKDAGARLRATPRELLARAEELYASPEVESSISPVEILPGEGWILSSVTKYAGIRKMKLSHVISPGPDTIICEAGRMYSSKNAPEQMVWLKKLVADGFFSPRVSGLYIRGDEVTANIPPNAGQPDRLPKNLYQAIADCMFWVDPDLQAVRLDIDPGAMEAAKLRGIAIPRSIFEPPAGPVPAT